MDRYQFIVRILEPAVLGLMGLATAVAALKHKRLFTALGVAATGVALWVVLESWNTPGGLEDLPPLIVFGYVVLPLATIMMFAAIRLGRPASWWYRHVSGQDSQRRSAVRYAQASQRADRTPEGDGQYIPASAPRSSDTETGA